MKSEKRNEEITREMKRLVGIKGIFKLLWRKKVITNSFVRMSRISLDDALCELEAMFPQYDRTMLEDAIRQQRTCNCVF